MRLDRMLWKCLLPGARELEESGTQVELRPRPGETVLFFRIDGDDFRDGARQVRVADLLVVGRRASSTRLVMLYVELKGTKRQATDAMEQLQSAMERVERDLPSEAKSEGSRDLRALVVWRGEGIPGNALRQYETFRRRLRAALKQHVVLSFKSGATPLHPANLRKYLPSDWPR